jgi:hypothetical protein
VPPATNPTYAAAVRPAKLASSVVYHQADNESGPFGQNGTRDHAAIITPVFSDTCVNLRVFFDDGATISRNSVKALSVLPSGVVCSGNDAGWRWPD